MKKETIGTVNTEQVIYALSAVTAAITNMKLYPSASAIIIQSVDKAYASVKAITRNIESLVFSESGKALLVNGQPLGAKIQKMQHVLLFLTLMHDLRVRKISFDRDMGKDDFKSMLFLLGREPEEIEDGGGIASLVKNDGISNIIVETAEYTAGAGAAAEEGKQLPLSFGAGHVPSPAELKNIAVSAESFHWVENLFTSVIDECRDKLNLVPNRDLVENVSQTIAVLLQSAPYGDSETIFSNIADAFSCMEPRLLVAVLHMTRETGLLDHLIDYVDEDGLVNLAAWLYVTSEKKMNGRRVVNGDEVTTYKATYDYLLGFERTRGLAEKISERIKKERQWQVLRTQKCRDGIQEIINGSTDHFSDELIMGSLPGIVKRMLGKGLEEEVHKLLDKVSEGLLSVESSSRDCVSRALYQVGRDLADADRTFAVSRLAGKLNLWIKFEVDVFPAYRPVCDLLREHVKSLIQEYRLSEANAILETFNFNYYGRIEKNDEIRVISGRCFRVSLPLLC